MPEILWTPPNPGQTPMDGYRYHVNQRYNKTLTSTQDLVQWSCDEPQDFWSDLYTYLNLQPPLPPSIKRAYDDSIPMSSSPPFFESLEINYAENALFANPDPNATALIGLREGQTFDEAEHVTWAQFRDRVRLVASALRRSCIKQGDRVAALVATSPWAVVLFHASAAIGAIFTCINPDLGTEGCVSRLRQVTPSIVFADGDAVYKGKATSTIPKLSQILAQIPQPAPQLFVIPIQTTQAVFRTIQTFLSAAHPSDPLTFTRLSFNAPLMICYSSGTTGAPKCIVHRHGLILQLKKISVLHNSLTPRDVVLQYSSTSWVVFYVMCGHFSVGATTVCYNGSPLYPDARQLLRMARRWRVTFFGTSPRYLLELEMAGCEPEREFGLEALRTIYTTGATLSAQQYRWFYRSFPREVQICNTAGGTDVATSLLAMDPTGPVRAGEMQVRALGMDVDVADPETGISILGTGEAGEMVVRKPFASMPCFFWGDEGGAVYRASYFERFSAVDVWAQHDWLSCNPVTGGWVMHGRSDGVLNPSGIRFGSAEIYALTESPPFNTYFANTLCVGRRRPHDPDELVFLFVVPRPSHHLTPSLRDELKIAIRRSLSARHVPAFIEEVGEIPVTVNGKKVEGAIKRVISGGEVQASATVVNPGSLKGFERFRDYEVRAREARL